VLEQGFGFAYRLLRDRIFLLLPAEAQKKAGKHDKRAAIDG
jgi:hypothetical protein